MRKTVSQLPLTVHLTVVANQPSYIAIDRVSVRDGAKGIRVTNQTTGTVHWEAGTLQPIDVDTSDGEIPAGLTVPVDFPGPALHELAFLPMQSGQLVVELAAEPFLLDLSQLQQDLAGLLAAVNVSIQATNTLLGSQQDVLEAIRGIEQRDPQVYHAPNALYQSGTETPYGLTSADIPAGELWELLSVQWNYTASGGGGNRYPYLQILDTDPSPDKVVTRIYSGVGCPASTTHFHQYSPVYTPHGRQAGPANQDVYVPLPPHILIGGDTLPISGLALQLGAVNNTLTGSVSAIAIMYRAHPVPV